MNLQAVLHVSDIKGTWQSFLLLVIHSLPRLSSIRAHPALQDLPLSQFLMWTWFAAASVEERRLSCLCKNLENKRYSGLNVLFQMMWHGKLHFVERDFSSSTLIDVYKKTFDPFEKKKRKVNYNFYCAILQSRIKFDSTGQLSEISAVICGGHNCC